MKSPQRKFLFQKESVRSNPYRILVWIGLIAIGVVVLSRIGSGEIQPAFQPTPLPTRNSGSYQAEGEAFFTAGNLDSAIKAYQDAILVDPNNAQLYADLARIQTYSTSMLTTDQKFSRLEEAKINIEIAVELDSYNSYAYAVQALVLDWYSSNLAVIGDAEAADLMLADAAQAAVRAVQLDNSNALALAFQAEVYLDQFRFTDAIQLIEIAIERGPELMDTHRVYALVLESTQNYAEAIEEYKAAAEINPNLTFLYISIGQNYRQLTFYDEALEYFDLAAQINEVLQFDDPLPYIAIAKTYVRQGEFFIAARNAQKAIELSPETPDYYGQLGDIFVRSRNYEGAIPVLKCAIDGCSAEENPEQEVAVQGLELNDYSVIYYMRYVSILAALTECETAKPLLDEMEEQFSNNELVMSIVSENRSICGYDE